MFITTKTVSSDWKDANALLIDKIAELLVKMSDETEDMQGCVGDLVGSTGDAAQSMSKLQRLDAHTQKQADIASVLRVIAGAIRDEQFDAQAVEAAAHLQELRDVIAARRPVKSRRQLSIGRLHWFD